jgi:hypothetical protein
MNKHPATHEWIYYLETPRRDAIPVKIDAILHRRLQAFMDVKKIKLLLTEE